MAQPQYDQLLQDLVVYIYEYKIPNDSPAWQVAEIALLDALGCAAECLASKSPSLQLLGPWVPETLTPNGFRLPGTKLELDPVKGALDLGLLIRTLDHNDGFTGLEYGHPSDNLGAICAVADYQSRRCKKQNVPGSGPTIRTVLESLIKSYEVQGRLQLANSLHIRGLDHVFLERIGACAAVCPLLELSRDQALSALSHCILDNAPLRTYRHGTNTIPRKGWAGGDAGSRAVQLALMARNGQLGAPTVLSAERWGFEEVVLGAPRGRESGEAGNKKFELGGPGILDCPTLDTYVIRNVFFKLMPCEGHALAAVEACLAIRESLQDSRFGWDPQTVDAIHVRGTQGMVTIISKPAHTPLTNPADRDHCLEYMLAVTLLKGAAPISADFQDDSPWASSEDVDLLRRKMMVVEDPQLTADFHDPEKRSLAGGVAIHFQNGRTTGEVLIHYPLGHPSNERTFTAAEAKYTRNLNLVYSSDTVASVVKLVKRNQSVAVCDLFDLLWKGEMQWRSPF